ncbi:MAG: hypothetical protein Q9187_005078 [Circinaria calcarea]
MSYGYNSVVAFTKSMAAIDEFAIDLLNRLEDERQSVEALVYAHERSKQFDTLIRRVRGVMFMGTPHRGSDTAYWVSFLTDLLRIGTLGVNTNNDLVNALMKESKTLSDIAQQFCERGAPLQIITCYETRQFSYMNNLIVDKSSALLNLPNERLLPIDADHRTICKFSGEDSQKYRPVWKALAKIAGPDGSDSEIQRMS